MQFTPSVFLEVGTKVSFSDSFPKAPRCGWEEIPAPDVVAACLATLGTRWPCSPGLPGSGPSGALLYLQGPPPLHWAS